MNCLFFTQLVSIIFNSNVVCSLALILSLTPFVCAQELSGLYGGFLSEQVAFARAALEHILTFYRDPTAPAAGQQATPPSVPPVPVVLVGHSVGGLVARALALDDSRAATARVRLVVTLGTPNRAPGVHTIL